MLEGWKNNTLTDTTVMDRSFFLTRQNGSPSPPPPLWEALYKVIGSGPPLPSKKNVTHDPPKRLLFEISFSLSLVWIPCGSSPDSPSANLFPSHAYFPFATHFSGPFGQPLCPPHAIVHHLGRLQLLRIITVNMVHSLSKN